LTRFMGRWQVIGSHPTILCDSAHNEAGLRAAFKAVAEIPHNRLHIVTGFVNDKDVEKVLPLFPAGARYYFAKANIPRGLDAAILREKAASFGLQGRAYRSVRHALRAARIAAQADDLIMVTGSIFVVAEVL
ncbi:MAG TPA: cyanophycin synthetase, partial [Saprospiraceae bacterium]|nr:cyanophycin synthetase [Saprospiraceae bacterium]